MKPLRPCSYRLPVIVLLGVCLSMFPPIPVAGESGMAHRSEPRRVMLNVSSEEGGYLQEVHSISFQPGVNRVRVHLDTGDFDEDSFLLVPGTPEVRVRRTSFLDDRTVEVVLESDVNSLQPVVLYARLHGLSNRSSYRGNLSADRETMHLREEIILFNRSGQSFEDAWLGVGFGSWLQTSLEAGGKKRIRIYEKESVPVATRYRLENAGENLDDEFSALPIHYVFRNTSESHLGDRTLRRGKVRFFRRETGSPEIFLGEARVPRTPVGDTVGLVAGKSNEVRAKRAVVQRERTNVRRNNRRRIQLYDEVKTIEYTVENNADREVEVRLSESMSGEWKLLEATHESRVRSQSAFEVSPTLPENSTETIRVTVKSFNNMPQRP